MDKTQSLIAMARRLLISHTGMPAVTEIPSDSDGYPLMLAYECARQSYLAHARLAGYPADLIGQVEDTIFCA